MYSTSCVNNSVQSAVSLVRGAFLLSCKGFCSDHSVILFIALFLSPFSPIRFSESSFNISCIMLVCFFKSHNKIEFVQICATVLWDRFPLKLWCLSLSGHVHCASAFGYDRLGQYYNGGLVYRCCWFGSGGIWWGYSWLVKRVFYSGLLLKPAVGLLVANHIFFLMVNMINLTFF